MLQVRRRRWRSAAPAASKEQGEHSKTTISVLFDPTVDGDFGGGCHLKFADVAQEETYKVLTDEGEKIGPVVEDRYWGLDKKLGRTKGKFERHLEIANRPLPDGTRRAD